MSSTFNDFTVSIPLIVSINFVSNNDFDKEVLLWQSYIEDGKRLQTENIALYEKIKDTPKSSYIAPNHAGNKHTENSFKRAVKALRRALNISMGCKVYRNQLIPPYPLADDFVPYDLRHTYCTRLCKQKVDIRVAQKLMGHSDIRLTANIYTHADNSNIIEAAQLMQASKKTNQTSDVAPAVAPTLRVIEK